MYQGNFDFGAGTYPIYDPQSTVQAADGTWSRTQFANNVIPQSQFDPVARNVLALNEWKDATGPGTITPSGPQQNLDIEADGAYLFSRYDVKIDHQFTGAHKINGRYSLVHRTILSAALLAKFAIWSSSRISLLRASIPM